MAGGDLDRLMEFMTDDCVFQSSVGPEPGATFKGRDEVRRGFELMIAYDANAEGANGETIIWGDRGTARWSYTRIDPNGNRVTTHGCDLFTFSGDRIQVKDAYRKVHADIGQ